MSEFFGQEFNAARRARFVPPACPRCGSTNVSVHWEDVTDQESTERVWTPTAFACQSCHGVGG